MLIIAYRKKYFLMSKGVQKYLHRKALQATQKSERANRDAIAQEETRLRKQKLANLRAATERKKMNEIKSGKYQIVTNIKKQQKYNKKEKAKLMRMDPEMLDALTRRKGQVVG